MVKNKGNKKDKPVAGNRDAVLKDSEDASVSTPATDFLEDMVMLHRIMWKIEGKKAKKEGDLTEVAERVLKIVQEGKPYELAGLKGVPAPFLKSTGRLLRKDGDDVKELTGKDATSALRKHIFQAFSKDDLEDMSNSPYKETKEMLNRKSDGDKITDPAPKDAILLECSDTSDGKPNDPQGGSKVIFTLASQLVSSFTKDSPSRVKAALAIMNGLYETQNPTVTDAEGKDKPGTPKFARFLVRTVGTGDSYTWKTIPLLEAAEFALTFAFEVFLEKELVLIDEASGSGDSKVATEGTSTEPIQQLDDYDVLFGRGGLTNAHAGNRRFRDIISLHRPDYIRAIKMDKPTVARKIVKAIRMGNPPGRFLKKGDDGMWYDVGDRTAAEKTSQGLRERSNAEKRQRSELRRALRIRKEDMQDDENNESAGKKAKTSGSDRKSGLAHIPTLNYVGTNLPVPLSLNMVQVVATGKGKKGDGKGKGDATEELNTEGLPPNAVDEEGNILVTDHDILCGRGGLTNHHRGNKRFRDIVALHRPDYVRAPKIQKPSVARVIVRAIRNGDPPGRFLRKDEKTGKWVDIGDKKAAEKTSQALREKSNEEREKLKKEPGSVGVLLPNPASYLAATTANVMGNILASGTGAAGTVEEDKDEKKEGNEKKGSSKTKEEATATASV